MQITPAPPLPPMSTAISEPQTLGNVAAAVVTQAVSPITQNAVAPAPKTERGKKSHRRGDLQREEERQGEAEARGDHINLSV